MSIDGHLAQYGEQVSKTKRKEIFHVISISGADPQN